MRLGVLYGTFETSGGRKLYDTTQKVAKILFLVRVRFGVWHYRGTVVAAQIGCNGVRV